MCNIYTGYYAKIKKYFNNTKYPIFISISGRSPKNWNSYQSYLNVKFLHIRELAPSYSIFKEYKESILPQNQKEQIYTNRFNQEILHKLNPIQMFNYLLTLNNNGENSLFLLCYESPFNFCHRHLVANWLNSNTSSNIIEYNI